MKKLKKIFAGLLLIIGVSITSLVSIDFLNPNSTQEDKEGALAAVFLFGVPSTAIGSWLLWSLKQDDKQRINQLEQQKEQIFLNLSQETEGKITITQFALTAQISIEEAKEYLDIKAKQLDANFEVSNEGGIVYKFPK